MSAAGAPSLEVRLAVTLKQDQQPSKASDPPLDSVVLKPAAFTPTQKLTVKDDTFVIVKLAAASFNRRDLFIRQRLYPKVVDGSILGSDGAGVVKNSGEPVVIAPSPSWNSGYASLAQAAPSVHTSQARCPVPVAEAPSGNTYAASNAADNGPNAEVPNLEVLGLLPLAGTFATEILVPKSQCFRIPSHLSFQEASALPVAGTTAFRACFTKGNVKRGDVVLIPGVGSGVALFAVQFCVAVGAKVYVTSSSDDKINFAKKLGAVGGVNYRKDAGPKGDGWVKSMKTLLGAEGGVDVVIDGVGGDNMNCYLKLAKNGAKIVNFGSTKSSNSEILLPLIFLKQISLLGTSGGSLAEFYDLLKFTEEYKIHPIICNTIKGLENIEQGFDIIHENKVLGKVVVEIDEQLCKGLKANSRI